MAAARTGQPRGQGDAQRFGRQPEVVKGRVPALLDPREQRAGTQNLGRCRATDAQNDLGATRHDRGRQVGGAGSHFHGRGLAIGRWAAGDEIGLAVVVWANAFDSEHRGELFSGCANKPLAGGILSRAQRFANTQ